MNDNQIKSLLKTFSWRIVATLTTMFLIFFITKDFKLMFEIGFLETTLKLSV